MFIIYTFTIVLSSVLYREWGILEFSLEQFQLDRFFFNLCNFPFYLGFRDKEFFYSFFVVAGAKINGFFD